MILVDTSVWIEHLRRGSPDLQRLLLAERVLTHPFVVGEVACGSIRNRSAILALLANLPQIAAAEHNEVLSLLDEARLHGRGLGWVDANLLCSGLFAKRRLWTLDRRLRTISWRLGVAYAPVSR